MTRNPKRLITLVLNLVAATLFVGCRTHEPLFLDESFKTTQPETVTLLPILDVRKDRSVELDVNEYIRDVVKTSLEDKGYRVVTAESFDKTRRLDPRQIAEFKLPELAKLGQADSSHILLFTLEDASSNYRVISKTVSAQVYGALIDKRGNKYLWRDRVAHSSGQGGLLGAAFVSFDSMFGILMDTILSGIPERAPATAAARSGETGQE